MNESILEEAARLTTTDRQGLYGPPLTDFTRTAKMWSAILGIEVKPEQVPLCMIAVKISRECNKHQRDNLTDMCGYANTIQMIEDAGKENIVDEIPLLPQEGYSFF
jgi:hypothetical protein